MSWLGGISTPTIRRGFWSTVIAGAVFQAIAIALFAAASAEHWRLACLAAAFVAFALIEHTLVRATETECQADTCGRTVLVAQLAQIGCMTVTGGLASPYLVGAVLPAVMPLVLFGPVAQSRGLVVVSIALFGLVAVLPQSVTGPPLPRASFIAAAVAAYASTLFLIHGATHRFAAAATASTRMIETLQTRRLATVEKRARGLRSFRARLADELRNPLSVIKGLVQLVTRSPENERNHTRLGVVEGEVARIERILDEYLSFRRPVEALDIEDVDLAALVAEAVTTVAQRAAESAIVFDLALRSALVKGDPDKLSDAVLEVLTQTMASAPPGSVLMVSSYPGEASAGVIKFRTSSIRGTPSDVPLDTTFASLVIAQHRGELRCDQETERSLAITIMLPRDPQAERDAVFFLPD